MSDEPENVRPQKVPQQGQEEVRLEEEDLGAAERESIEGQEAKRPVKKKPAMPPSRIAFLIFAAVAVVAIIVEAQARWGYSQTVKQLQQTWEEVQSTGEGLYRKDLEELVHGWPSREYDQQNQIETFAWRGIRSHRLRVRYSSGEFVVGFETLAGGETQLD